MTRRGRVALTLAGILAGALLAAGCSSAAPPKDGRAAVEATDEVPPPPLEATSQPTAEPVRGAATSSVPAVLVTQGDTRSKKVALTFDLCETYKVRAGFDAKVYEVLVKTGTRATFFMGGRWAETHQKEAAMLGGQVSLFEIGNNSYSHKHPTKLTAPQFEWEVTQAQEVIRRYSGATPRVYRFPYGEYDKRTLAQVARLGLVPVQWTVETGDPDKNVSAAAIIATVKKQARGGSIVIMHANGRGWHTAEALPAVIDHLRSEGFELVTVSELLETAP